MQTNRGQLIEFFDGPVDGCVDRFSMPLKTAIVVRADPHTQCTRFFSSLNRFMFRRRKLPQVVVAVYELNPRGNKLGCDYLRSSSTPETVF